MTRPTTTRRTFLKNAALAGGVLVGPGQLLARASHFRPFIPGRKTERVILIAFAGGVRTRETLGTPGNVPNLVKMAEQGVLYTRVRTANLGHFGASLSIFTGLAEPRGIRENARGNDPTLFEYIRKDAGLDAGDVWITTSGGAQQVNYAYGLHPDYGARFGANTLDGEGIFNREFKALIAKYGLPKPLPEAEQDALARLRASLNAEEAGAAAAERIERYILDELTGGTSDLTGANAGDAKALRLARNLLSIFKPRVVSVVLRNADIAHGSFNGYSEVVRRNDAAVGELWDAVQGDPELRATTAFVVVPEFGRDQDLNTRRGLDHGDGSEDLRYVTCLLAGPDFKRGKVVKEDVRITDVTPTVCELFGANAKHARGKVLPGLFA